jgi:hypothetical protein
MQAKRSFAPKCKLTSNQVGAIGVALTAIDLLRHSEGLLAPSDPYSDDHGTDLYIHYTRLRRTAELQIKVRLVEVDDPQGEHRFGFISRKTTPIRDGCYVLAVLMRLETNSIVRGWLVPTTALDGIALHRPRGWVLAPNASRTAKDKYTPWRHDRMATVAAELLGKLGARS